MLVPLNEPLKSVIMAYTRLLFVIIYFYELGNQHYSLEENCDFVMRTVCEMATDFPEVLSHPSDIVRELPAR